ncbi:MAG: hypothetical protein U0974_04190 [Gemmatimonadales bacterium]|nr:hypothetical protein [Gemmatimonadales bacterium]MDZ4388908.1 hypothetical protein [Gemmatimonadales bacterium]
MADQPFDPEDYADEMAPNAVLATTDQPVAIEVREIDDDRVPEGMRCLGTFLDGTLVARCAVPPGAAAYFDRHAVFGEPRQLVLAAREEDPGLRCELYAIVPMPSTPPELESADAAEPWAASVPGSGYEQAAAAAEAEDEPPTLAAVLLGQIIRFSKDRRHPESLPLETVDILARIVSGRVVEVVDRLLDDLLGGNA